MRKAILIFLVFSLVCVSLVSAGDLTSTAVNLTPGTTDTTKTTMNLTNGYVTYIDKASSTSVTYSIKINNVSFIPSVEKTDNSSLVWATGEKSGSNIDDPISKFIFNYDGNTLKETIVLKEDKQLSFPITTPKGSKLISWGGTFKIVPETGDQSTGLIFGVPFGVDAAKRNILMKYIYTGSSLNLEYSRDIYIYNETLTIKTNKTEKDECSYENGTSYTCNSLIPQYDRFNITYPLTIDPTVGTFGTANFTANLTCAATNTKIQFNDTSTGSATQWRWWFGDESYSSEPWYTINSSPAFPAGYGAPLVTLPNGDVVRIGDEGLSGAGNKGVWSTSDGGKVWTLINASTSAACRDPQGSSAGITSDGTIYSVCRPYLWNSTDSGYTWTYFDNNNTRWQAGSGFIILPNNHFIQAGGGGSSSNNLTWLSTNLGTTWTLVNSSPGWTSRNLVNLVVISNGSVILTGNEDDTGSDIWITSDEGSTWRRLTADIGFDYTRRPIVRLPDGALLAISGYSVIDDIWVSTNEGVTWSQENNNPPWSNGYFSPSGATVLTNGDILVAGGYMGGNTNTTYRMNTTASVLNSSATLQNPTHSYASTGLKTVGLIASNATTGYSWATKIAYINISASCPTEGAPNASFSLNKKQVRFPQRITVNDTSTNTPTTWNWSWGDGTWTNGTANNTTHQYLKRGNWNIQLIATNAYGSNTSTVQAERVVGLDQLYFD